MVFVRRPGIGGFIYQTYGEEATHLARMTKEKVRYVRVGTQKVATFTLNRYNLQPVIHRLNELGLSVNVVNAKGKTIYYKQDISSAKKEAIKKIKDILTKVDGDIRFNEALKDMRTEQSGDGYSIIDKKGNTDHKMEVQGVMTDIYGALHVSVKDSDGNTHTLYLDRLTEKDVKQLAESIEQMHDSQEGFMVIPDNPDSDELDKVLDDNGFSTHENDEYSQRSSQNR